MIDCRMPLSIRHFTTMIDCRMPLSIRHFTTMIVCRMPLSIRHFTTMIICQMPYLKILLQEFNKHCFIGQTLTKMAFCLGTISEAFSAGEGEYIITSMGNGDYIITQVTPHKPLGLYIDNAIR